MASRRHLGGQDSQGRHARRPPRRAGFEIRAGSQSQDRQGPWPDDPAVAPPTGGSGDRVVDRRAFIVAVTGALLAAPVAAEAQQTRKVPRVGVLGGQSLETSPPILALRERLSELGYVEGGNIAIEWRWAQGKDERYSDLAAELVKLKVDIIVAATTTGAQAAQRATRTIPIVMGFVSDPVALGLFANLTRPAGNITSAAVQPEMAGKRLQLLREAAPTVAQLAVLSDPSQPGTDLRETEAAGRALAVH